ncbi:uncharacterized protein MYCFIDRAFT_179382 [Pseudocercospora fijiensis CIRAD86]|uniref:Uncharacterized protein n=1 Tax=Pseudocercospora fijiensis (strain CIRAD86) TaxID=383855 RepID=M2YJJ5_PSEFD|nr:uncharacterized protein MYCFIDRAFT_179382 [Pseudocercospora fijiensis CIRAD86]EME77920.1 hypothetical protein MYCFIDRAFT_179382 [Pseudocercospora fijiensis CIRAD86]
MAQSPMQARLVLCAIESAFQILLSKTAEGPDASRIDAQSSTFCLTVHDFITTCLLFFLWCAILYSLRMRGFRKTGWFAVTAMQGALGSGFMDAMRHLSNVEGWHGPITSVETSKSTHIDKILEEVVQATILDYSCWFACAS